MITRNIQSNGLLTNQNQGKYNSSNSYSQSPYQRFDYSPQNKSHQPEIPSNFKRYTGLSNQKHSNFSSKKKNREMQRYNQNNQMHRNDDEYYEKSNNKDNSNKHQKYSEFDKPQYELLLEYELKREQQKNKILNERLKNKEEFIHEIKTIQEELTKAYSKCQQELNQANSRLFQLDNYQIRNYIQEIEDLKHQLKQVEISRDHYKIPQKRPVKSKSNIILKNNRSNEVSFRNSGKSGLLLNQNNNQTKRIKSQYQTKNVAYDLKKIKEEGTGKILKLNNPNGSGNINAYINKNLNFISSPKIYNSSTGNLPVLNFTNQNYHHKQSVYMMNAHELPRQYKPQDAFQQQILLNLHKVANFIKHFMQMSKLYVRLDNQGQKLTHKLKSCWRWIKQVVRQWDKYRQNQKQQKQKVNKNVNIKSNENAVVFKVQQQKNDQQKYKELRKNQDLENNASLKKNQIICSQTQNLAQQKSAN